MKRNIFSVVIISLIGVISLGSCGNNSNPSEESFESVDLSDSRDDNIFEVKSALESISRVKEVNFNSNSGSFRCVFTIKFEQYIDHKNAEAGTFLQEMEFGFNGFKVPNVLVTNGYGNTNASYFSNYSSGENELAFLLGGNYLYVEHRYFRNSMPVTIDYDDDTCWKYLTTEQAASDHHDIVTSFKEVFSGKWISTGMSKSGMTTHLYGLYYPGDVDLYVPYVAPFCNSITDLRMMAFLYETAGNEQYGEEKAAKYRKEVLDFQIKLLEYRDVLEAKFYKAAKSYPLTSFATKGILYDCAVLEFAIGTWQYYQEFMKIEKCLAMDESTEEALTKKMNAFYKQFTSICPPSDYSYVSDYASYFVQSYQELGNYGYDFHYIREALPEGVNLAINEDEERDAYLKLMLNEEMLKLEKKELVYSKINNMLKTTNQKFIIIYGSSDPWYSVRPDDVFDNPNVKIYVDTKHPHTTHIGYFDIEVRTEIINLVKSILHLPK
ncbi:MAG: hypothetical protein IJQ67_05930 [Bacilli bacterium]|nr:hypothetical protein [Bacilli bacterium]